MKFNYFFLTLYCCLNLILHEIYDAKLDINKKNIVPNIKRIHQRKPI